MGWPALFRSMIIWGWVIFGLVFLVVGALHLRARDN